MSAIPPTDPLTAHLTNWRVNPRRHPQFRAGVWARIQRAEQPSTWSTFARTHSTAVAALIVAGAVAGAWSGRAEARNKLQSDRSAVAANYVHSLDARWMRQR